MGTFELKLYKKDNKFYLLTNLYNWSDKKLVDFAKLLEKYDSDAVIFDDNPAQVSIELNILVSMIIKLLVEICGVKEKIKQFL